MLDVGMERNVCSSKMGPRVEIAIIAGIFTAS